MIPSHPVQNFLQHPPVHLDEVRHQTNETDLKAHDGQDGGQDEGLDVAAALTLQVKIEKPQAQGQSSGDQHAPHRREDSQGAVHRVEPDNGDSGESQERRDAADKTGRSGLGVGAHRDVDDPHFARPGLDESLQGVGVVAEDGEAQGGLAAEGTEAAGGVGDGDAGGPSHDPTAPLLEPPLEGGEVLQRGHPPVTHHDVGLAVHDGPDQPGDVLPAVLVIGVGVDDDVGAQAERRLQAGGERCCQPLVLLQPDDVVGPRFPRHLGGAVGRAVVHHQHLYPVHPRQGTGQVAQGLGEGGFFVVGGNLDDEFHKGMSNDEMTNGNYLP